MKKIIKLYALFLVFPIKVAVWFINGIRRLSKGKALEGFAFEFRTRLQNEFNKIDDRTYIIREANDTNVKLTYLDIGSRAGLSPFINKNKAAFQNIILCEGEPEEVKNLKSQGFLVIDKFLGDQVGPAKFYFIPEHTGASSLKRPGTPFLHLFSSKHYNLYTKYTEHDITTSTLDIELEVLGVKAVDFIKIDVQGSELSVIKGLTTINPLFWEVEMLPLPTYEDTPYGTQISTELLNKGYISFRQKDRICKDGIYIYSNELYMPDYSTQFGKELIRKNIEKWRTMMELFDAKELANHIETLIR
ncbi:MAG TPA: FkbM family methyltransferase [Bacteroidia bacterium]